MTGPLRPRPGSRSLGGPLVHVGSISSTNDLARRLAQSDAPDGTVVVAEQQTAGRGRQGRSWVAPPGMGLTLSALVRWNQDSAGNPATAGGEGGPVAPPFELLPLVAAVAVAEACERAIAGAGAASGTGERADRGRERAIAGAGAASGTGERADRGGERAVSARCAIKWPNDVWIDGRKVAGILIEARPQEGWAVVGVGVNVGTEEGEFPSDLREKATSLRIAAGTPVGRDDALDELLERLAARLGEWRAGAVDALLDRYRERDALSGGRIAWDTAGAGRAEGRAQGIDGRGNLVVLTNAGDQVALEAGEVHLLRS